MNDDYPYRLEVADATTHDGDIWLTVKKDNITFVDVCIHKDNIPLLITTLQSIATKPPAESLWPQISIHSRCILDDTFSEKIDMRAEIHRLRAELEGPDGFATWKEAACAERRKRIQVENALNKIMDACHEVGEQNE